MADQISERVSPRRLDRQKINDAIAVEVACNSTVVARRGVDLWLAKVSVFAKTSGRDAFLTLAELPRRISNTRGIAEMHF